MAPTEVLARQHYQSVCDMFEKYGVGFRAELLTGSMKAKERREAYARIESGEADVVIGTHALIQDKVQYHNLGLVITDEQHRFGVRQREALAKKGKDATYSCYERNADSSNSGHYYLRRSGSFCDRRAPQGPPAG